jgi:hypothetical protein
MTLRDSLAQCITGDDADALRRRQLLNALVDAYERGGADAAAEVLDRQMQELAIRFDAQLTTVEKKTQ